MDSLVSTTIRQKAKETKLVQNIIETYGGKGNEIKLAGNIMETYGEPHYNMHPPPPPPTWAEVAQPRARRSSTIQTVTNWQDAPQGQYQVQTPYTHPYDQGMSDFPRLSPATQEEFETPSREESPFHPHLPYIVDVHTLREAVNKDAGQIFDAIITIMEELHRVRDENEDLKRDNLTLKENWMDVSHQAREAQKNLTSTKTQLRRTQNDLNAYWDEFSQRRGDWYIRAQRYEELLAICSAKQVLLWKLIERIREGDTPEGDRNWENAVPSLTGTHFTPTVSDSQSEKSGSIITEFRGSPERAMSTSRGRTGRKELPKGETSNYKRSSERGLDPAAVSLDLPKTKASKVKGSPERGFNPAASSFVPGVGNPAASTISDITAPALPQVDLLSCILSLPPRFYGICPNSLCASSEFKCRVPACRLQHVCEAYNDEKGGGCKDGRLCRFVHEYRSCYEEIDGFGCRFMGVTKDSKARQRHLERRAHQQYVSGEEWRSRVIIAGLRGAHREGKY
ncbi:uncharacterized protein LY89DRAFT_356916 [Mollisia scopiformis]|uniref:C3H1-type domain-containing protein n=1 Tax=Mollisia scopiformis TaxID=149040 RepID=A0A132B562_MOLSC|nr:uncharacterized protein LY89DRAFT_356916 [Mollisia scopiformis]KUJ07542.1 hypothetical protein LY89DRAFT_356916 [Mollisia scopiformis]